MKTVSSRFNIVQPEIFKVSKNKLLKIFIHQYNCLYFTFKCLICCTDYCFFEDSNLLYIDLLCFLKSLGMYANIFTGYKCKMEIQKPTNSLKVPNGIIYTKNCILSNKDLLFSRFYLYHDIVK